MADFNVIANVSETLEEMVTEALKIVQGSSVPPKGILHDLHEEPSSDGDNALVAITLVEVREDPTSRNRSRPESELVRRNDAQAGRIKSLKPPMALRLRYLMTPWRTGETPERRLEEHVMLGRVAQVFYDNPILSGLALRGSGEDDVDPQRNLGLAGSDAVLAVTLVQLTFEEQTRFWHAVQLQYRPSLTYDVRVVDLDSTKENDAAAVSSRELRYRTLRS